MKYDLMEGDCLQIMRGLPDSSVDLVVTSPPYDDMRDYNGNIDGWGPSVWQPIARELFRVVREGGVVVWVVGDQTRNHSESGSSFRQALFFQSIGFNIFDTMIYEKAQACFGSNRAYLQCFEYMFVFSKGKPLKVNLIYDRANVRGGRTESTVRAGPNKNGVTKERHAKTAAVMGRRKNIWRYGVGGGDTSHPAVFPLSLAEDHILSWSNPGDCVLDPFMGSGTTGVACANTGRRFIGTEIDPNYFDIACGRVEKAYADAVA